jgi:DNA polymerase elongation subunit (family B)
MKKIVAVAAAVHKNVNLDMATEEQPKNMSWSVAVRALGSSAGDHYPARLPHDLKQTLNASKMNGVMPFPNERAMISWLLTRIGAVDPDIINAHNLYGFDMDVLLTRAVELKIGVWSKIGRLRRFKAPQMKSKAGNFREGLIANAAIGRILTDT